MNDCIEANGVRIAYDDVGGGTDTITFLHGHPFNRSMWAPQLSDLRDTGWRLVAPDLRGYGDTPPTPGDTTLDVFATDLACLLDELRIDRAVVVGLSMGGQVAMAFAKLFPSRVRALVLTATSPLPESDVSRQARLVMAERFEREGAAWYADQFLPRMLAPASISALPAMAEQVLRMMRATDPQGAASALRGRAARPSYVPMLAQLDVPALICVGDNDSFTTRGEADLMRRLIRRSQLLWLCGSGHMPNLERSHEFNAALRGFLAAMQA